MRNKKVAARKAISKRHHVVRRTAASPPLRRHKACETQKENLRQNALSQNGLSQNGYGNTRTHTHTHSFVRFLPVRSESMQCFCTQLSHTHRPWCRYLRSIANAIAYPAQHANVSTVLSTMVPRPPLTRGLRKQAVVPYTKVDCLHRKGSKHSLGGNPGSECPTSPLCLKGFRMFPGLLFELIIYLIAHTSTKFPVVGPAHST